MPVTRRVLMQAATSALTAAVASTSLRAAGPVVARSKAPQPKTALNAMGYLTPRTTGDGRIAPAWQIAPDSEMYAANAVVLSMSAHTGPEPGTRDLLEMTLQQHTRLPDGREIVWSPWHSSGGSDCVHSVGADCRYVTALDRGRCSISLTQIDRVHGRATGHVLGSRWDFCVHGSERCVALRRGTYLIPLPLVQRENVDWTDLRYASGHLHRGSGTGSRVPHVALHVEPVPA